MVVTSIPIGILRAWNSRFKDRNPKKVQWCGGRVGRATALLFIIRSLLLLVHFFSLNAILCSFPFFNAYILRGVHVSKSVGVLRVVKSVLGVVESVMPRYGLSGLGLYLRDS